MARPRLVIFNFNMARVRTVLAEIVQRLDHEARVAGDAVQMPSIAVQFHLESSAAMRNVTLISTGDQQSHSGWKRLAAELSGALAKESVDRNPRGFTLLAVGLVLLGWPLAQLMQMPSQMVAQQLRDMLRI
jgi:hypothetical protein